jgi:hypothetical protein
MQHNKSFKYAPPARCRHRNQEGCAFLRRFTKTLDATGESMTNLRVLAVAVFLFFTPLVYSGKYESSHLRIVEQFISAFNAQDSGAMAALVTDDVDWLSIVGAKVAIETTGKNELVASMDAYFKSCSTCQSALSGAISTAERVSAIEVASWQGKTGPKSQKSLSVYEFSDGLIRRVYYFPAEKSGGV